MTSAVWYHASLSSEQVAAGHVTILQRLFAETVGTAAGVRDVCLFVTCGEDLTRVFFSPNAIALVPHLIAQYGAQPSPPPERATAELLVGSDQDWNLLPRASH